MRAIMVCAVSAALIVTAFLDSSIAQPVTEQDAADSEPAANEDDVGGSTGELRPIEDMVTFQFGNVTEQGIEYYLGGFITLDLQVPFSDEATPSIVTFDNHHADLFVGANYRNLVLAEFLIEWEHSGEGNIVRLLQGALEWRILHEALALRAGTFLVPLGLWNSEYWPDYLNPVINRPYCQRELVPVKWQDVGIELRGRIPISSVFGFRYNAYAINGLQAQEGQELGLSPRHYRMNTRDVLDPGKAYGGRLGLQFYNDHWDEFEIGGSFYRGAYDPTGDLFLTFYAAHASIKAYNIRLLAEYAFLNEEVSSDEHRDQWGFYGILSYRVWQLEPVVMWDMIRLDLDPELERDRLTVGLNAYPIESFSFFVLKATYAHTWNDGVDLDDDVVAFELTFGF